MTALEEQIEIFLKSVTLDRECEPSVRSFTSLSLQREHVVYTTDYSRGNAFSGMHSKDALYIPQYSFFNIMQELQKNGSVTLEEEGFGMSEYWTEEYDSSDQVGNAGVGKGTICGDMLLQGRRLKMRLNIYFRDDATLLRYYAGPNDREEFDAAVKDQKQKYFTASKR